MFADTCVSVRGKIVPDYVATFHHESNPLQLGNVGDRISSNGNEISKFPGFNRAHLVLPAQHFRGIRGDGANHIERRHSGIAQLDQGPSARLPARLSRIKQHMSEPAANFTPDFSTRWTN